jgi:TRAP-type mannitol/chloroaromatic compound transport system permease large subunit
MVALPANNAAIEAVHGRLVLPALLRALGSRSKSGAPRRVVASELVKTLLPALTFCLIMGLVWHALTKPAAEGDVSGLEEMGMVGSPHAAGSGVSLLQAPGVQEPPSAPGIQEPPAAPGVQEPPVALGIEEPPGAEAAEPLGSTLTAAPTEQPGSAPAGRLPTPTAFWIVLAAGMACVLLIYGWMTFPRLEIFKMLLGSFFPLAIMILAVLGTIVFGLATPTEAAAIGALGGFVLAAIYFLLAKPVATQRRVLPLWIPLWMLFGASILWFGLYKLEVVASVPPPWLGLVSMSAFGVWSVLAVVQMNMMPALRESAFLTARTTAMVCWLFVGSSIFSAAFALLGGQGIVERWVLSLDLTPTQFLLLSQGIIFILGWPLEWTEIIVIFMPIFIPLLEHFSIDPLFFGLLVALNLQTAFLSPPVAMAAFYLKGVSPPHVTLNQIFAGMIPFMVIQVIAMALLYIWPQIGLWLPTVLYR